MNLTEQFDDLMYCLEQETGMEVRSEYELQSVAQANGDEPEPIAIAAKALANMASTINHYRDKVGGRRLSPSQTIAGFLTEARAALIKKEADQ